MAQETERLSLGHSGQYMQMTGAVKLKQGSQAENLPPGLPTPSQHDILTLPSQVSTSVW